LYFLKQRIRENEALAGNSILLAYDQGNSEKIFEISTSRLKDMSIHVEKMIDVLTNYKSRQYFIIKDQPK